MSEFDHLDDPQATESVIASATRRGFLMLSLGLLAGCAKDKALVALPNPPWPTFDFEKPERKTPRRPTPQRLKPLRERPAPAPNWQQSLLSRSKWSRGNPIPTRMDRMAPIRYLTVHHEGMDAFRFSTSSCSIHKALHMSAGASSRSPFLVRSQLADWDSKSNH